jgi:hypothetical protein
MTARRRALAATIAAVAAVLLAYGAYRLVLVGTCETGGAPGVPDCPPDAIVYALALAGGIVLALGDAAVLGYGPAFAAAFAGAGAGITAAAIRGAGEGRLWALLMGVPFLVLGGALLDAGDRSSLPARRSALLRSGRRGMVTILDVADVHGETAPGTHRVRERVRVQPVDGEPYDSERTRVVETPPMIGERYAVRIDPADPHHWTEDA